MLRRVRKSQVQKDEIIADIVFLLVSFVVTEIALFIFDIHWNFYPGGQLFPPAKYVFENVDIYLWGGLLGSIVGFFMIKIFLFGLKEEEATWKK
jgi:hypothetical protein